MTESKSLPASAYDDAIGNFRVSERLAKFLQDNIFEDVYCVRLNGVEYSKQNLSTFVDYWTQLSTSSAQNVSCDTSKIQTNFKSQLQKINDVQWDFIELAFVLPETNTEGACSEYVFVNPLKE
jgi:hypothetical protein